MAASRRSWTTTICLRLKLTASSTTTTTSTSQTWIATRPSGNQKRSRITSRRSDLFAIPTLGTHIQNDHGMSQKRKFEHIWINRFFLEILCSTAQQNDTR